MVTLQLFIDLAQDGSSNPCHTFVRREANPESDQSPPFQFKKAKLIGEGDAFTYRGKLSRPGYKARTMICKVVTVGGRGMQRLKNEADLYQNELKSLQGLQVPIFYGIYLGVVEDNPAACILLEDCGAPLIDDGRTFPIEIRILILEALMTIHKCGVLHGDFDDVYNNIVVDDPDNPTRVFVVDFGRAERHQCDRGLEIRLYEFPPRFTKFKCQELYLSALELDIWTPDSIPFRGGGVPLILIKGPESLVEHGPKYCEWEVEDGADPVADARKAMAEYGRIYGDRAEFVTGKKERVLEPRLSH